MPRLDLDRDWFARDAPTVALDLLNKLLVVHGESGPCAGRIVETEAYMPDDPASHSFGGRTARNAVMFGPAGRLYVYLIYGIHQCANVVTGSDGSGQAVLVRSVVPVDGLDAMRSRRGRPDRDLANGPGKLCQALGIGAAHNGVDLLDAAGIAVVDDGVPLSNDVVVGPRVGITKAIETPWRFRVPTT